MSGTSLLPPTLLGVLLGSLKLVANQVAAYFEFYSARRPHKGHAGRTPDMVYFDSLQPLKAAA